MVDSKMAIQHGVRFVWFGIYNNIFQATDAISWYGQRIFMYFLIDFPLSLSVSFLPTAPPYVVECLYSAQRDATMHQKTKRWKKNTSRCVIVLLLLNSLTIITHLFQIPYNFCFVFHNNLTFIRSNLRRREEKNTRRTRN